MTLTDFIEQIVNLHLDSEVCVDDFGRWADVTGIEYIEYPDDEPNIVLIKFEPVPPPEINAEREEESVI